MRRPLFALATILIMLVATSACGASASTANARALEIAAHTTATAGDAIALASESSAASECPTERPDVDACLDALAVGWAPVDRAFGLLRSSLGAWYATSVALRAGEFDLAIALTAAQAYAEAYAALALVALDRGLRLPALPTLGGAQ